MTRAATVSLKYLEVMKINLRSQWAYLREQFVSNLFLAVVIFVSVQLWRATYDINGAYRLEGYSIAEMIWYLVFTEGIILSLPPVWSRIEQEIRSGDIALALNKPYSYLMFHYWSAMAEGLVRLVILIAVGGSICYLLVGGFAFSWYGLPVLLLVFFTTQALNFCYTAMIGLLAFWTEDVSGAFFVLDRMKWILGGFLLPLEVFPDAVRKIANVLPFRHMIYGPARLAVKFSWDDCAHLMGFQAIWFIVLAGPCVTVYRMGVRRINVNGG